MNPDIVALLQKARESLKAAEVLRQQGFHDFGASRAYYTILYAAEAALASEGLAYSSHAAVHAAFGREFAKTGRLDPTLHRYLLDAQAVRTAADYGIGMSISAQQSADVCAWAGEFLRQVEAFLASPNP